MIKKKKFIWHLYPFYLGIMVIALVAIMIFSSILIRDFYLNHTEIVLRVRALYTEELLNHYSFQADSELQQVIGRLGKDTNTRITLILPDGIVIADSEENPEKMDNHADRPEFQTALHGEIGKSVRYSYTLEQNMMYVAMPYRVDGKLIGFVRTSMPIPAIGHTLMQQYSRVIIGGIIAIFFAILASFLVSHRINRRLQEIQKGAERFARGDLHFRLPASDVEEIGSLAETMNSMAMQLNERIETITGQRNELEAVLTNMVESVLVLDEQSHIVRVNRASMETFRLKPEEVLGENLFVAIRNPDLHQFVTKVLASDAPLEGDIIIHSDGDRFFQANGSHFHDHKGNCVFSIIVLNDVTRLKKLEKIRRDFVANVSHELKTPITSIKGFVETLRDGAIEDAGKAHEFLDIVARHSDRLNAIIEDLLSLSRIEQDEEKKHVELTETQIKPILKSAMLICKNKAAEKNIAIVLECPDILPARTNSALLEQAIVNLIDNAIKYSDEGSEIKLLALHKDKQIAIEVSDHGCGIPQEDISRIFERFYRVDKARSRKLGGTGLGLAIVKHIVQAHRGEVIVESEVGKGSTFEIRLPI